MGIRTWFALRIEFLSLIIIIPGFFFCLAYQSDAGMFALMLKYTLSITEDIGIFMNQISKTENRFISYERCDYFMKIDPETGYCD